MASSVTVITIYTTGYLPLCFFDKWQQNLEGSVNEIFLVLIFSYFLSSPSWNVISDVIKKKFYFTKITKWQVVFLFCVCGFFLFFLINTVLFFKGSLHDSVFLVVFSPTSETQLPLEVDKLPLSGKPLIG